jgi:Asparagine synthase
LIRTAATRDEWPASGWPRNDLYGGPLASVGNDNARAAVEAVRGRVQGDPLALMLYLDARLGLVDHILLYFDRTSTTHSLRGGVPYMDRRLVEAATVPSSIKIHRGVTKRVLNDAGLQIAVRNCPQAEVGFFSALSIRGWTRDGERVIAFAHRTPHFFEVLNRSAVETLVADYRRGHAKGTARLLFAILPLESWLTRLVDANSRLSLT